MAYASSNGQKPRSVPSDSTADALSDLAGGGILCAPVGSSQWRSGVRSVFFLIYEKGPLWSY